MLKRTQQGTHPAISYWLIQLPGLLLIAILAAIAANHNLVSASTAILIFIAWLIKDLILYPVFARTAWLYYPMGQEALIGERGEVVREITPNKPGQVRVKGEIWQARSVDHHSFKPGEDVEVFGVDGLTAFVKPTT
ncbi:putative activity regulator of membrane protease YbbK [Halorhodospira halochloris]|uniref:Activity regulator of membrane protease YbbK n=1 Tax=Halorhodospira halochloris TaxID=1052 RepID=A0A120MZM9_HALHR|nr:NfeD family protein [Halorhodospira halochloris]MBK1651105.1 hypothetical protein [Halorhodospira halochloris]MCG5547740.1 NfeD family protein [Halorhodospira halochloris]BAU57371.1 putative activity regulator of membrane protease YbbK [Halorhodospira halochloris]